jgi:hypothetical protein
MKSLWQSLAQRGNAADNRDIGQNISHPNLSLDKPSAIFSPLLIIGQTISHRHTLTYHWTNHQPSSFTNLSLDKPSAIVPS